MAGSAGIGLSARRRRVNVPVRAVERAAVQRRPVLGNSPDDRKDYPDFESSQESLRRCPPARSMTRPVARRECALTDEPRALKLAFSRHDGIYRPDVANKRSKPGAGCRLPLVGPGAQSKDATGATTTSCSSYAMSSGRLFLDRVARQQSPSPLHRHPQNNMAFSETRAKGDISTLPARGHFYFALTSVTFFLTVPAANVNLC
jgi:hypothetical protein